MNQNLPVDTSFSLQEEQSVSTSVQDWVIGNATIKQQAFLDGNMDEVTTDMINEPAKRSPRIKLMIFCCTVKGDDLNSRISPGVTSSFDFFLLLPQNS